jgi:hypothetical protein
MHCQKAAYILHGETPPYNIMRQSQNNDRATKCIKISNKERLLRYVFPSKYFLTLKPITDAIAPATDAIPVTNAKLNPP